jgi:hypothetical protein
MLRTRDRRDQTGARPGDGATAAQSVFGKITRSTKTVGASSISITA